jgi:bacterial/archaeal transporter family protein
LLVALAMLASRGFRVQTDAPGVLAAIATGVCGLGGAYLFLLALERGKASVVVPFTSLYPLVTLALSVLLLRERPSPANLVGIAFAVVAVALLSSG